MRNLFRYDDAAHGRLCSVTVFANSPLAAQSESEAFVPRIFSAREALRKTEAKKSR